ncbi:MAG: hypothetical protein RLN70_02710, partial [Rhodospirillaceae bacterium]
LEQGAQVTLVCTKRLAPLFTRSFPTADIKHREDVLEGAATHSAADFQASFSHLGAHLRSEIAAFPTRPGYLKADHSVTETLRPKYLANSNDLLVGISWHSKNNDAEAEKSIPLALWGPVLRVPGVRFVSLQYGSVEDDVASAKAATGVDVVVDPTVDPLADIDRFAAQVAAMDLVITVSNTTAHVAGALGRPTWVLTPYSTGRIWYWFL